MQFKASRFVRTVEPSDPKCFRVAVIEQRNKPGARTDRAQPITLFSVADEDSLLAAGKWYLRLQASFDTISIPSLAPFCEAAARGFPIASAPPRDPGEAGSTLDAEAYLEV